jgi:DNA-binding SARP family transcriptional activator
LQPTTRFQVCGPLVVEVDGERRDRSLPGRQGRLLLAYLLVNRRREVTRDEVVEALWPGGGPDDADAALNVLTSRLRKVVAPVRLESRGTVRLWADDAWVDLDAATDAIHAAESAVARRSWSAAWVASQGALVTARRGFLPGEDLEWVAEVRGRLELLLVRALEAYGLAALGLGGAEVTAAREAGRSLVRLAPLRESGHRLLMRALASEGNVAEAVAVYEQLGRLLREELGVAPSGPTRVLHDELVRRAG